MLRLKTSYLCWWFGVFPQWTASTSLSLVVFFSNWWLWCSFMNHEYLIRYCLIYLACCSFVQWRFGKLIKTFTKTCDFRDVFHRMKSSLWKITILKCRRENTWGWVLETALFGGGWLSKGNRELYFQKESVLYTLKSSYNLENTSTSISSWAPNPFKLTEWNI